MTYKSDTNCVIVITSSYWQDAMEALKKTFKGAAQGLSEEEQRHQKCEDMREKALTKCACSASRDNLCRDEIRAIL